RGDPPALRRAPAPRGGGGGPAHPPRYPRRAGRGLGGRGLRTRRRGRRFDGRRLLPEARDLRLVIVASFRFARRPGREMLEVSKSGSGAELARGGALDQETREERQQGGRIGGEKVFVSRRGR